MKVTIELPDELYAKAKAFAAARDTPLECLMIEGLEKVVAASSFSLTEKEAEIFEIDSLGVSVLKKRGATIVTNEMVNQMREEMGI